MNWIRDEFFAAPIESSSRHICDDTGDSNRMVAR